MLMEILWGLYSLTLLITTTIFLQVTIQNQQASIPNLNVQFFNFIYISHWIFVGLAGLMVIYGAGFGVLTMTRNRGVNVVQVVDFSDSDVMKKKAESYRGVQFTE